MSDKGCAGAVYHDDIGRTKCLDLRGFEGYLRLRRGTLDTAGRAPHLAAREQFRRRGEFPANRVSEVKTVISPATAQG